MWGLTSSGCRLGAIVLLPSGLASLQTKGPALINQLRGFLPAYWTVYRSWPQPLQFGGFPAEGWITSQGATPVIAWEPNVTCAGVVDGTHDAYLNSCAATAVTYAQPLYVRLMYEFNGGWEPYGVKGQPAGNSYAQFVAAWQHVVGIFRSAGATNVKWIWNPNVDDGTLPFSACYPGDSWVDIVGLDGYNQSNPWQTFGSVFASSVATIAGLTSLPLWICETGCAPTSGANTKSAWFTGMFAAVNQNPAIAALNYFNDNVAADYTLDSSGSDLAALEAFNVGIKRGHPSPRTNRWRLV